MSISLSDWLLDWLTDWLIDCLTSWITAGLNKKNGILTLGSVIAQVLVGPSNCKQLKQIIQIVKNHNRPEANQLAFYKLGDTEKQIQVVIRVGLKTRDCWIASPTRWPLGHAASDQTNERMTDWLTDWMNEWMNDWVIDWLTDGLTNWLTNWRSHWFNHWLPD